MSVFITISASLAIIAGLCRLGLLAIADYPRTLTCKRGHDAFGVVLHFAWAAWGAWLLWGQP